MAETDPTTERPTVDETDAETTNTNPETTAEEETGEAIVEEIAGSLADDGFDVFSGRQFVSIRQSGQIGLNSTLSENHFSDKEAVMLSYNDDTEHIAIIPLEHNVDSNKVYSLNTAERTLTIGSQFLRQHDLAPEKTTRYTPEWDETLGGDVVEKGLKVDLSEDGEVAPVRQDSSDDTDPEQ